MLFWSYPDPRAPRRGATWTDLTFQQTGALCEVIDDPSKDMSTGPEHRMAMLSITLDLASSTLRHIAQEMSRSPLDASEWCEAILSVADRIDDLLRREGGVP